MSDTEESPPSMDTALRTLLRGTRGAYDDEASRHADQALERLARAIPILETAPADPSGPDGAPKSTGSTAGAIDSARATASAGALTKATLSLILSLTVGGAIGATVTHLLERPRERIVYVDRPVVPSPALPASAPSARVRIDELPGAATMTSSSAVSTSLPRFGRASTSGLSAERLLLDDARAAFASGDYAKALERLQQHEKRHADGALGEERDALAIRTLAALGRTDEAAARKRAFVTRYPESIMRSAVESALGE